MQPCQTIFCPQLCPVQGFLFSATFSRVYSPLLFHFKLCDLSTLLGFFVSSTVRLNCSFILTGWKAHWNSDKMNTSTFSANYVSSDQLLPLVFVLSPFHFVKSWQSNRLHHAWKDCIQLHCFNPLWSPRFGWCWSAYLSICVKPESGKKMQIVRGGIEYVLIWT